MLLPDFSDLGMLAGLLLAIITPTSAVPPLVLSLALVTIFLLVELSSIVQLLKLEVGPLDRLLFVNIPQAAELSGPLVTMAASTGLLRSTLPPLATMTMATMIVS